MKTEGDAYGLKLAAFAGKVASADGYGVSANGFGIGTSTQDLGHRPGSLGFGGENFSYNGIDNIGGVRIGLPSIFGYNVNLTGLWARNTTVGTDPINGKQYNNLGVFGADLNGTLPFGIGVTGEYAQDITGIDSKFGSVNSSKYTQAWNAGLDYTLFGVDLKATYQQIYPEYDAPGSWDQIGSWINPSNIKGVKVEAAYPITSNIAFKANGSSYKAITNVGEYSPLGPDDKVGQASANIDWKFTKTTDLDLGYEWVQWDLSGRTLASGSVASGKPLEQYVTIGVGHSLGKNAAIKALYQVISYDDKSTGFDSQGNTHGGVFVTQASLKF
jgi:predicted porin